MQCPMKSVVPTVPMGSSHPATSQEQRTHQLMWCIYFVRLYWGMNGVLACMPFSIAPICIPPLTYGHLHPFAPILVAWTCLSLFGLMWAGLHSFGLGTCWCSSFKLNQPMCAWYSLALIIQAHVDLVPPGAHCSCFWALVIQVLIICALWCSLFVLSGARYLCSHAS